MSQVYVRSGRGGAGNFKPKEAEKPAEVEMQPPKRSVDLEAQNPTDPSDANSIRNGSGPTAVPQYKTYARGGAGNWYEPEALKQAGTFSSDPNPTDDSKTDSDAKRTSRVWQGRGGMGNWEADQAHKEEAKRKSMAVPSDEEAAAIVEEIKEEARREADAEIKPPESAHIHVPHLDRHVNLGRDEVYDV